jgi:osmoprotectant transport system permease protein
MDETLSAALALLPGYLSSHVLLSAAALALALVISLPLAVLAARRDGLRWAVLTGAGVVQTIPSLALLALFYPLLLLLSTLTRKLFGFGFPALGFLPSLIALTLYAMLPILRNAVTGLKGVDPAVLEAADGVGMSPGQRLRMVEAPLAAPVAMAGVRTAAVLTIGAATLATPIGQTSLGNYIFSGLQTEDWVSVAVGCVASAALALVADQLLALIETGLVRRDARRIWIGALGLLLGTMAAAAPMLQPARATYVIGAKNFGEQFILNELIARRLEAQGYKVVEKQGLGSAVIFRALAAGEIDAYVDYSGTLWSNVMKRTDRLPRQATLDQLKAWLAREQKVTLLGPLGFENAYALAMKEDRAARLGVRDLADLGAHAPALRLGSDLEFLSRPEWTAVRTAYGLEFKSTRPFNPTFMYQALAGDEVDVISAFSSDGRIAANRLRILTDSRGAIPPYDAVLLISPRRANDMAFKRALEPLINSITVERMRQANLMVDRAENKQTPAAAAAFLSGRP